jgi:hypothetical protein
MIGFEMIRSFEPRPSHLPEPVQREWHRWMRVCIGRVHSFRLVDVLQDGKRRVERVGLLDGQIRAVRRRQFEIEMLPGTLHGKASKSHGQSKRRTQRREAQRFVFNRPGSNNSRSAIES